jgi:hypothetical protein
MDDDLTALVRSLLAEDIETAYLREQLLAVEAALCRLDVTRRQVASR